ncbi:response regulator transcription factor [Georgenia wangjunii]|uniref:response regulator transcription factor n=1 Tax=Georgenia wangjunii TaxID=3117730 RepID=UPI002F26A9F0
MAGLLILTAEQHGPAAVLPALALLDHHARLAPMTASALVDLPDVDVIVVDGRRDLAGARTLCRLAVTTATGIPVLLVLTEGGLTAVTASWGVDDVILEAAGPAETAARLRLLTDRVGAGEPQGEPALVEAGELSIDAGGYTARVRGRILDLTYKEFELLKYLAQHPGRVFTRAQLLQEVWGYDYYGGTRTVDVHVRRLRAKLGSEHDQLIGTVRNVGYRFELGPRSGA